MEKRIRTEAELIESFSLNILILSICITLPSVFKTFILPIFEWSLKTGYTVLSKFNFD